MLNKIEGLGGFVFYVGVRKTASPDRHKPNRLYTKVLFSCTRPEYASGRPVPRVIQRGENARAAAEVARHLAAA